MTDSNPNFANEGRDLSSAIDIQNGPPVKIIDLKKHINIVSVKDSCPEEVSKYIVKAPPPNSKLILQNMEEVLNSVKKKHRQKHRRKREQKKLAQMEAAAVAVATAEMEELEEREAEKMIDNLKDKPSRRSRKADEYEKFHGKGSKSKPLQEKTVQENSQESSPNSGHKNKLLDNKSPLKGASGSTNGDILQHFQRMPKKSNTDDNKKISETDLNTLEEINEARTSAEVIQPQTMNAFEVMMNARNKPIGSNTLGKEISQNTSQESTVNTKRRLMLQDWADKKGGTKRKLEEDARAAYVDHQLENRAKRFKQMLVQGSAPTEDDLPSIRTSRKSKKNNTDKAVRQSDGKPKPKTRRANRLWSTESDDDIEEIVQPDKDTAEFLAKLNSPTKKRDSLLGYFSRKILPTEITVQNANEMLAESKSQTKLDSPKSRTRRSIKSNAEQIASTTATPVTPLKEEEQEPITPAHQDVEESTANGRPKRSCAGKARYDYDLEVSPTKLASTSTRKGVFKSKKNETYSEQVVIDLDDSNLSLTPEKFPKKLAPVFMRALPKPSPDPVAVKARQDFLMSGVPEKMRLEMEKQKQYEQTYDEAFNYFPRVCHVQQLSTYDTLFLQAKRDFNLKLKPSDEITDFVINAASSFVPNSKGGRRKSRCSTGNTNKSKANARADRSLKIPLMDTLLPTLENKRTIVKFWKSEFDRFPTFKCYNQMREKYRFFSALDSAQDIEQVSESFVVTRRTQRKRNTDAISSTSEQDDVKPPATAPNGELLFTEKYKPMLVEQVLVNLVPVTQLRDFLATWVNGTGGSARDSQTMDDSFDTSNDSTSSISNVTGNTVVLLGPVSSGKTNAVYALANDMNFNVLEINAGMKRTGKRLIQELQEATQSHQIPKDTTAPQSSSKAQKNLLRMSLNGQKLKKQNSQGHMDADSGGSCNTDINQNTRKCLILIEDADVVFDQLDNGFVDAIYTLAASSKRPVIVMATNPNCLHLQRLMNQNTIYFTPPNTLNISRFMAVLSLIENCPINLDDLVSLYLYNGKDLRRTLLELQFFIQSGGDRKLTAPGASIKSELQPRTTKEGEGTKRELGYFASPTKRRESNEDNSQSSQEPDEELGRDRVLTQFGNKKTSNTEVYIHRSLFEFFTCNQNEQWRIPFPVDFNLLHVNLIEVFQCSRNLQHQLDCVAENNEKLVEHYSKKTVALKRKTRMPKITCNSSSVPDMEVNSRQATKPQLDVLCDFYENISIAALLSTHNADMSEGNGVAVCGVGLTGGGSDVGIDRLLPHISEHIAHGIVEGAISVNLGAKACPYNLFNTPTVGLSLCDYMNSTAICYRSRRTRSLDVEPALRAICRSEKQRAMQERRSTRFYHYLRHSAVNVSSFSTEPFDKACSILQYNNSTNGEEEQSAEG